jgi:hypothetical protein
LDNSFSLLFFEAAKDKALYGRMCIKKVVHTGCKFLNSSESIIYAIYHSVKSISLVAALIILLSVVSRVKVLERGEDNKKLAENCLKKMGASK